MVVLASVGVPPEGIAIILGVDRILDMSRTVLNVSGDLSAAVFVARTEPAVALEAAGSGIDATTIGDGQARLGG
jgi:DAACS family dicarboxylate/amino acid:cation (Na+ or H+) symporter